MKPDVPVVMARYFGTLATDVAPNLNGEYSAGNASTMGLSLYFAAQEFERAAEIRVRENDEMRSLFAAAQADDVVSDEGLRVRLGEASTGKDESLTISALDETNATLKALLIDLQIALEAASSPTAAGFEGKVWDHVIRSAERRKLVLPEMG